MSEQPLLGTILSDELKNDPVFKTLLDKPVDELGKSYREASIKVSRKGVILPPDGAKPEEWDPVYTALGRPEKPEGYELPKDVDQKTAEQLKGEIEDFKKFAFENGMSKTQFQKAFGYRLQKTLKEAQDREARHANERTASETALRSRLGAKYDETIDGVQKLIDQYGGDDIQKLAEKYGDGKGISDPHLISLLGRMLGDLSEATLEKIQHRPGGNLSPDEAKAKIAEIRADDKHPYNNPTDKKHAEAKKEMDALYLSAHPGVKKI